MFNKIAIAATLALLAGGALAADDPKWYVGADVGSTRLDQHRQHERSVGAVLGYRINDTFAVEASARRLGEFDLDSNTVKVDQYAVSAVASVPLSGGFKAFGRLGVNSLNTSADSTPEAPGNGHHRRAMYGAGVSYDFTPAITGRVEVQRPSSDTSNISTGVAFKF